MCETWKWIAQMQDFPASYVRLPEGKCVKTIIQTTYDYIHCAPWFMLGLPPAFMLSLINKALDTTPSQWARSERRVSHAADHISSWRRCSKPKTNGRLRTLGTVAADSFGAPFFRFQHSCFRWKRQNDHKMLWKNEYSKWWLIHLIYRRILWKKF